MCVGVCAAVAPPPPGGCSVVQRPASAGRFSWAMHAQCTASLRWPPMFWRGLACSGHVSGQDAGCMNNAPQQGGALYCGCHAGSISPDRHSCTHRPGWRHGARSCAEHVVHGCHRQPVFLQAPGDRREGGQFAVGILSPLAAGKTGCGSGCLRCPGLPAACLRPLAAAAAPGR